MDRNVHHGAPARRPLCAHQAVRGVAGAWLPPVWWASSSAGFPRPAPTPPQGVTKAPQLPLQAEETQLSLCTKAPSQQPSLARASWGCPGMGGLPRRQQSWQKSPPSQQHRGAEKAPAGNTSWGCTLPGGLVSGLKCKQQQERGWWWGLLH